MAGIKDGFPGSRMLVLPKSVIDSLEQDPYTSLLYTTAVGFFPHAEYHFIKRGKGIDDNVMIYCTSGNGWIKCRDEVFAIASGQVFVIPSDCPHSYGADSEKPWTIYWIHFRGKLSEMFMDSDAFCAHDIQISTDSRISQRLSLFDELYNTLDYGYSEDNLKHATSTLIHFLSSIKFIEAFRHGSPSKYEGRNLVEEAKHFMNENIDHKVSLKQICNYLGCSESTCSAAFRKSTGMSPIEYMLHLRIQKACKMLLLSDQKINQIASSVGIDDQYYFSRLFRKFIGVSPSEYRKRKP